MKLNWLSALVGGLGGLAFVAALHLMLGSPIDALKLLVFGGIGVAISMAVDLGRQNGRHKAEFGKGSGELPND